MDNDEFQQKLPKNKIMPKASIFFSDVEF